MKIGILTYHRATNYGAVLQAYSLITYLNKTVPEVCFELIDYSTNSARLSHLKNILSYIRRMDFKSAYGEMQKNKMFLHFSNSLPLSSKKIVSDRVEAVNSYINSNYDIVITGSDAIFSWAGKKFPTAYFLHDIKRITLSYAASAHRLNYRSEGIEKIKWSKEAFEGLNYIGIRDKETEKFVRYCGCTDRIYHNCDPTFLLDIKEIHHRVSIETIKKKCGIDNDLPICVLMTSDPFVGQVVKNTYGNTHKIVSVFINNPFFNDTIYTLTPFEWATLFSLASFTVTEYFHATILSLLNLTPVLSIDKSDSESGYDGKIKDLLVDRLRLPEMYVNIRELLTGGFDIIPQKIEHFLKERDDNRIKEKINNERVFVDSFTSQLSCYINDIKNV